MKNNIKDEITDFYDKVSSAYAKELEDELSKKPVDQKFIELFLETIIKRNYIGDKIREIRGLKICDLGCGSGEIARFVNDIINFRKKLNSNYSKFSLLGLDVSENMIKVAKENNPTIEFKVANTFDFDFPDNHFSGILSFYMIVNFSDQQLTEAFEEIYRILEPNGLLLLSFHSEDLDGNEQFRFENSEDSQELTKVNNEVKSKPIDELFGIKASLTFYFFSLSFIKSKLEDCEFYIDYAITRSPNVDIEYPSSRGYIFASKK